VTASGALAGLIGLGLVAGLVGRAAPGAGPAMSWERFRSLCAQWAHVWGVPEAFLLVVGMIESSQRPGMTENTDPRAVSRGGSWGLFGMTAKTAAALLAEHAPLRAQPAARAWNGTGESLHDPHLAAMLASFYLATLWHRYGDPLTTVVAYQQGPGNVDPIVARGGDLATELPPKGREYLAHAARAFGELQNRGAA
jgi:hypothetical protein